MFSSVLLQKCAYMFICTYEFPEFLSNFLQFSCSFLALHQYQFPRTAQQSPGHVFAHGCVLHPSTAGQGPMIGGQWLAGLWHLSTSGYVCGRGFSRRRGWGKGVGANVGFLVFFVFFVFGKILRFFVAFFAAHFWDSVLPSLPLPPSPRAAGAGQRPALGQVPDGGGAARGGPPVPLFFCPGRRRLYPMSFLLANWASVQFLRRGIPE